MVSTEAPRKYLKMQKNRIHELRLARGMSIEDVSAKTGISPSYLSLMATGKRNISMRNLLKIAEALGARPGEVIDSSIDADIVALWASIPPERQDLARKVLESFSMSSNAIDTPHAVGEIATQGKERKRIRKPKN